MTLKVGEYLEIDESSKDKSYRCRKCGHTFCSIRENYKDHAAIREVPLNSLGNQYPKTERFCFREFFCPGCMTLLWVDMTEKGLPILFDHELGYPYKISIIIKEEPCMRDIRIDPMRVEKQTLM